jgi:hypothetical protein
MLYNIKTVENMLAERNFQNLIFVAFKDYAEFVNIYKIQSFMVSKQGHIIKSLCEYST